MRLHEYQAKLILSRYGIPIPRGRVASSANEAKQIAEELGLNTVIKAQVLVGGRGKLGGIRLAKSPKEAEDLATQILGMEIKGMPVRRVLVDEAVSIQKEIFLGLTYDRESRLPVMIASSMGGIDIEETARKSPEKIQRMLINPLIGLRDYQVRDLILNIDLPKPFWRAFIEAAQGLWRAYSESDATLLETNPLVITADQRLIALDCKMIIDDNALYRHTALQELRDLDIEPAEELEAHKYGLSYVPLSGSIGCLVNGAGLAMATMDIIRHFGGMPANFLDIGGGATSEKVSAGLRIILSSPKVRVVLVNIFGGITRCDEVAKGIMSAVMTAKVHVPLVIRLVGTHAEEGLRMLADANLIIADTLADGAQKAVSLVKGISYEYPD
ncbi:MAG TPA: ADP-forming succinate--CoA ligase subunit beta [Anaerolineaceae bacterium]